MLATNIILTIELVPQTCWFSNVRDHVDKVTWDRLRREVYRNANSRCEVCGGRGPDWPVECHEVWQYDDENKVQKLTKMIALCPSCHECKHIGLAGVRGRGEIALKHLAKVNHWSPQKAWEYFEEVQETWEQRSEHEWKLDITFLEQFGIKVESKR